MRLALLLLSTFSTAFLSAADTPQLTLEEKEVFLKSAKIVSSKAAKGGITGSTRATLSDGRITHDAHIQIVDEAKARFEGTRGVEINFRDSYKFNIAGYRLAKLLHINMVPPSVARNYQGKEAAFTWWVDDVMFDEAARIKQKAAAPDVDRWNRQMHVVRLFDQLIYNTDRNLGNLVITKAWDIWMIDHTRAFRLSRDLLNVKNLVQCDRALLAELKKLSAPAVKKAVDGSLTDTEISSLLHRRDKIVKLFEAAGDGALFSMEPRP